MSARAQGAVARMAVVVLWAVELARNPDVPGAAGRDGVQDRAHLPEGLEAPRPRSRR